MTLERIDSAKPVGQAFYLDGQVVIKPLPGFEHLFSTTILPQEPSPSPSHSPPEGDHEPEPGVKTEGEPTAWIQETFTSSSSRKRSPSQSSLQDAEDPPKKRRYQRRNEERRAAYERKKTEKTVYTLHIGDVESTKLFYRTRLREIGLKALRQIVTEWVKIMEPNRLRLYGPYHKKAPSISDPDRSPPWWSPNVPYEEPAHLQVKCTDIYQCVDMYNFAN
jgi:hypothetical protein